MISRPIKMNYSLTACCLWILFLAYFSCNAFLAKSTFSNGPSIPNILTNQQTSRRNVLAIEDETKVIRDGFLPTTPKILPAKEPLSRFLNNNDQTSKDDSTSLSSFSILSWNILLPNGKDNWWNHKMYASWVPMEAREWSYRKELIRQRLLQSDADIICIQEADGDTFDDDFDFLIQKTAGYSHVLHKKFRFRCATFFKSDKFVLQQVAHKDRVLITSLQTKQTKTGQNKKDGSGGDGSSTSSKTRLINVLNCHLSGGAAPERRLRQVHDGVDQIRKWKNAAAEKYQKQCNANRPNPKLLSQAEEEYLSHERAGLIVCGDFNSDGNTGVRKFLVDGKIDPDWREPQYHDIPLTSKVKEHEYNLLDAAELTYGANVCDGDYGEKEFLDCRPATYVVPNLASLLLKPVEGQGIPRTQFGPLVAQGLADTLGLDEWCQQEIDRAFEKIDLDGSGLIEEEELQALLEKVYVHTYGREHIERERHNFLDGFGKSSLTKQELSQKLVALQQALDSVDTDEKVSKGIVETLGLSSFCQSEIDRAFQSMDLDGNGVIDEYEIEKLLESVYVNTYGRHKIEEERRNFFNNFWGTTENRHGGLSKHQVSEKLLALQQELKGGTQGSELVEIRTEADAQRMVARFTPVLLEALDFVFDKYSENAETLNEETIEKFLIKVNGELGRGGTWRHTQAILDKKREASEPAELTRQEFYSVFARELGEGKWWQVVYDLEICGAKLRPKNKHKSNRHYQGWLDYIYFNSDKLKCSGFQEGLTKSELSLIYEDGDALPNEWHPSDHIPVAAVFSFHQDEDD